MTGEGDMPLMPHVTFLTVPMRPCFTRATGLQEAMPTFGTLHGADLEDTACFFDDLFDQLSFVDGQRERFFAVDVFSRVHRFDRDLRVPVVGRGDHHRVDVLSIEDLSIVLVGIRFLALFLFRLFDVGPQHIRVDVGECGEIGELKRLLGDGPALISKADGRKDRAVIGRLVAEGSVGRREHDAGGPRGGHTLEKSTTCCLARS